MVDARLKDGSRVNAIIPPLALKGPAITIRKFNKIPLTDRRPRPLRGADARDGELPEARVELRQNIVVSGGTGSGKTTLLNVLSSFIPDDERIVTVEDSAELQLRAGARRVARDAAAEPRRGRRRSRSATSCATRCACGPIASSSANAASGEALDMLQAMNTGHDGSMTTLHANSPRDALARLETLVLMAGMDLPVRAIRDQIASAVHMIVQQTRLADGSRKVTSHLRGHRHRQRPGPAPGHLLLQARRASRPTARCAGRHVPTGYIPRFYERPSPARHAARPVDLPQRGGA